MITKKLITSVGSIVAASAILVGGTFAYFTATASSEGNTLGAATAGLEVVEQNGTDPYAFAITNWAPGDSTVLNFDILNTGSIDLFIRGYALGTWGDGALDAEDRVKVTKVERYSGGAWEELDADAAGITGYFYYSLDGTDTAHFMVAPDARAQLRLTVEFDVDAGDDFQGQTFTAGIFAEGRQTDAAATWPAP